MTDDARIEGKASIVQSGSRWLVRISFAGEAYEVPAATEAEAQRLGRNLERSLRVLNVVRDGSAGS